MWTLTLSSVVSQSSLISSSGKIFAPSSKVFARAEIVRGQRQLGTLFAG
jgi:hypothetical protein